MVSLKKSSKTEPGNSVFSESGNPDLQGFPNQPKEEEFYVQTQMAVEVHG